MEVKVKKIEKIPDVQQSQNGISYSNLKQYLLDTNISNNYLKDIEPFLLDLPDGQFAIKKLLRIVPKKRLVFFAKNTLNNQSVIIKLFINDRKHNKDYKLLLDGYNRLKQSGLLTPQMIFSDLNVSFKQAYVITEYIENHSSEIHDGSFVSLLINAIVDLHKNFLYQTDLHLNNFIVDKDHNVHYLDCETIVYDEKLISNKKAYDNFSLFLVQLSQTNANELEQHIEYYLGLLSETATFNAYITNFVGNKPRQLQLDTNHYIFESANQQLKYNIRKFVLKTKRSCSDYILRKQKNVDLISNRKFYNSYENLFVEFTASPKKFIDKYKLEVLKHGNTAHVYLINYHGVNLVIKYYLAKNFLHKMKFLFKKPRCLASWENANVLKNFQIKTSDPITSIIFKKFGLINQSYFIMGYDVTYKSLASLGDEKPSAEILTKLIHLLSRFKALGIAHRDFKTVNLGLVGEELLVLDLDAMKIYKDNFIGRILAQRAHLKDVNRLFKCWRDQAWFTQEFEEKFKVALD